jgi:hypothetical protein
MRSIRCIAALLAFFCLLLTHRASAQTSVYGSVVYDNFGFTGANYNALQYKGGTGGIIGGVFYTFPSSSRFKAGIDGRVLYSPGYNGGSAYSGALRVSFVPDHNRLRPFFQLGGGLVSTQLAETICNGFSCGTNSHRINSGAAHLDFGLDIRLTDHIDLRAIDYGADASASNGNAHANVAWLGAGVIYHFHPAKHKKP